MRNATPKCRLKTSAFYPFGSAMCQKIEQEPQVRYSLLSGFLYLYVFCSVGGGMGTEWASFAYFNCTSNNMHTGQTFL